MTSNRMYRRTHPRPLACMVVAASLILTAVPFLAVNATAQPAPAPAASNSKRPVVIGTGNRLSGRLPVLFVGPDDHYGVPDIRRFAEAIAARCDLKLELRIVETLESPEPEAAIVLLSHVPTAREAASLRASPGTLAVLGMDWIEDLPPDLVQDATTSRLKPGDPDHGRLRDLPVQDPTDPGILAITLAGEEVPRLFAWSAITHERFQTFLLVLLRNAVEHETGLRHVPTAFQNISSRMEHDRLMLDVTAAIPGTLTQEVLDLSGRVIVAEGPIAPVSLATVPDPDRSLLRLRFQGRNGLLVDEARFWFRDMLPETLPSISVRGPSCLPAGEPLRLRVDVATADHAPVAGARVQGRAGPHARSAVTDAAGSAWLVFPDLNTVVPGILPLQVQVPGPHFDQTVSGRLRVVPRTRRLHLETDRPVVRPGQAVQIRAVLIDSLSCHAVQGRPVSIEVTDPADTLLARFQNATGAFGETVFRVPISDALAEGTYNARATQGTVSATTTFRVEDLKLPRFRIRVRLDKDRFQPAEPITGTVQAETFSGEPLQGATVRVELTARRPEVVRAGARLDTCGMAAFTLAAPEQHASFPALFVTVDHHGAFVRNQVEVRVDFPASRRPRIVWRTEPSPLVAGVPGTIHVNTVDETGKETCWCRFDWRIRGARPRQGSGGKFLSIPVPADQPSGTIDLYVRAERAAYTKTDTPAVTELEVKIPIQEGVSLEMPHTAKPGSTFPVTLRASRKTALVHLDLVAGELLLAGSSAVLNDGEGQAVLTVPGPARGPAMVVARFADQHESIAAQKPIDLVTAPLTVSLTPDRAEARPGETVACAIQVQDATGRGVRSLLDVRGVDRAYREVAGDPEAPLERKLDPAPASERIWILARHEPLVARARMIVESDRLAWPVLARAAAAFEAGQPCRSVLPWGARVQVARIHRQVILRAEPAVTGRREHDRTMMRCGPEMAVSTASREPWLPVRAILPPPAPPDPGRNTTGSNQGTWFQTCQAPDGSFPVLARPALYGLKPGESPGDPWLEPGTTGLVLLAHFGTGYTHRAGRYQHVVRNALDYLLALQTADGFFGDPEAPWAVLNQAICTQAVAEAYGMSNDPVLRPVVDRALSALAARQRPDGSFSETGFQEASLVCTTWTSQALDSARSSGLPLPGGVVDRIEAWIEDRTDPETGRVAVGKDEVAHYPFSRLDSLRHTAALPAMIRIMLLHQDPEKHPVLEKLGKALATARPEPGDRDLHGLYFGTLAMFQFGGPLWRTWNLTMRRSMVDTLFQYGPARGAWPGDGRVGRIGSSAIATLALAVYYRYGKVFGRVGSTGRGAGPVRPRRSFPDLLVSDLAYPTAPDGRASIPLRLPGSITPWDLRVGAWDGKGGYGVGRATVRASLPLHLEVDLPSLWHEGDRGRVPVRVHSRLPADTGVVVRVRSVEGLQVCGKNRHELTVPAGGVVRVPLEFEAGPVGPGRLVLEVTGGTHQDAVERSCTIRTRAFPVTVSRPVRAGDTVRIGDLAPAGATGLRAEVLVTADPLGDTLAALEGLIQRPTGCFEQTTATLQPALLALQLLEASRHADRELVQRARDHLLVGYQRILAYEVQGGGFSLYGEPPARPDLTALGIHVLLDLKDVLAVDPALIRRAAAYLKEHRPGGRAERLYTLAALARAGHPPQAAKLRKALGRETDPYLLALSVCLDLVPGPLVSRTRSKLVTSAIREGPQTTWKPGGTTLFTGYTNRSWLETTALAVEALIRLYGPTDLIEGGLATIRRARHGDGAWSTTRETVACLRALLAATREGPARGTLHVQRGKERIASAPLSYKKRSATLDLGQVQRAGRLSFTFEGQGTPHITLRITGATTTPPARPGPLSVHAGWSHASAPGAPVHCVVSLENRSERDVYAALVEVPIPAGFEPDRKGLQTAAKQAGYERAEVREGRLYLYLNRLPPSRPVTLRIPFVAGLAGRFHSGAVRAWPYYEPELAGVAPSQVIQVGPAGQADPAAPQDR